MITYIINTESVSSSAMLSYFIYITIGVLGSTKSIFMKKTTFFKSAILSLLACVGFVACNNNVEEIPTEPETYTVQLGWAGEILDVSYEPLATRATATAAADDLYGIQVYSAPNSDSESGGGMVSWTPYAYGLFDGTANISINLLKDCKYKFVATMVRNGKNKLAGGTDGYSLPFGRMTAGWCPLTNSFNYHSSIYLYSLGSGETQVRTENGVHLCNVANIERYYGELVDYVPAENGDKAKINMKRTSFGAKFIVKGKLAKEGTLQITIGGGPAMELELTDSDNQISDIFTFSSVYSAWATDNYTETLPVVINWIRTDDGTKPLGTHNITYKRNATTVVNVNIENDVTPSGLGFNIPDSETGTPAEDEDNEVTITDGEIVDTDVETDK